jgi:CARDB
VSPRPFIIGVFRQELSSMLRRARLPLAVGALALLVACQSDNTLRSIDGPMYAVSDGAHHGNPDFFFLSPLFNNPNRDPNFEPTAFNGALRPAVEICELGPPAADNSRVCIAGPLIKRFAPGTVNVSLTDQQYQVNWNTTESNLDVTKYYRISVLVGPTLLGFADVDPVSNGSQLKNVQTGEYIGLVDGRTLPIRFRIEDGALCGTDGTACAAQTINLNQGGGVELTVPGEDFHFDIPAGTQATAGGQAVTEVTFNLERCDGIDVDLPKFGQCLRVTALYDAPGAVLTFTQPILISMCSFVPVSEGQQELITLHQQDGDLIRALPHAHPNCNVIGMREAAPSGLLARSWHWVRDVATTLVAPSALHAETHTTMLHLGGGGETTKTGAECTPPPSIARKMALTTCTSSSTAATPLPQPGRTISDFQFALPAKMDYVDPDDASRTAAPGTVLPTAVKVTDWNGDAVQGAVVTFTETTVGDPNIFVATSNADGIAQVSWEINAGPNSMIASGRGIAAQNNYPGGTVKPFMPDIFTAGAPQTAVVVGTGEIPFLATGGAADLTIHDLSFSPIEPVTGEITLSAIVSNTGQTDAGPVTISLCGMEFTIGGAGGGCNVFEGPSVPAGGSVPVSAPIGSLSPGAYTVTASVDTFNVVPESDETNNKAVGPTFGVGGVITFESYPGGAATCGDCRVGTEFASRGVTFSFTSILPPVDTFPHICNSTPNDPVPILIPQLVNHAVTAPAVGDPCNGWRGGAMTMTFTPQADTVEFRVRGPDLGSPSSFFPITAFDGTGAPLPDVQILHTIVGTYTPAGPGAVGTRREERILVVTGGEKISRVVVDENGSIKFVDNLRIAVLGP